MAAVTRSVGKTGRDYSSLGAAIAAYGTDFVTGDDVTLECYNDDGAAITESAITIPDLGGVGSLTIKPASGNGALGHPNDHRTRGTGVALDYDPAAGVAFYMSASFAAILDNSNADTSQIMIEGIQFRTSNSRASAFTLRGLDAGSYLDGVITVDESSTANNNFWSSAGNQPIEARNCIFYTASTDRGRLRFSFADATIKNCTFVATAGTPEACASMEYGPESVLNIYNCVSFGFGAVPTSANTLNVSHCATDLATFPGTSNQTSLTPSDELENVTLASFDGRAKSTGSLPDNASTTYAPALDILGQTRDGTPTIGAYEYLTAGGGTHALSGGDLTGAAPVLDSPALSQAHALSGGDLAGSAPALDAPALSQAHALSGGDLVGAAPVLDAPSLSQAQALSGGALIGAAPVLDSPALSLAGTHALSGGDLLGAAPVLDSPALSQVHALAGGALAGSGPVLDSPALVQAHALATGDLLGASPVLDAPALRQVHALVALDLLGAAPVLDSPALLLPGAVEIYPFVAIQAVVRDRVTIQARLPREAG